MIAFLVQTFPKLSETFVHGEIAGLERAGLALAIYALARPEDALVTHDDIRAPIDYVPDPAQSWRARLAILIAHLGLLLRAPWRYREVRAFAIEEHGAAGRALFARAGWLAARLREQDIRHLHVHFASRPADVAELATRLAGIGYSLSAHAKDIYLEPKPALARKLAGARFAVTCTEYNRTFLSELAAGTPVRRMYHGIDLARLRRGDHSAHPSDAPLVLAVGRLREKKGFATLVAAAAILAAVGLRFRCEIVGYGPQREELAEEIAKRGLQAFVQLTGKLPHAEVIERYRAAALFVLPCQIAADGDRDGIPNVLLEAMAMSLPVVTTDVSGIPEVVEHGVNGLVVSPGDALGLAQAIARVLGEPTLAMRLGAAGRACVERMFDADRNLTVVRELLARAVANGADSATSRMETLHV